MTQIQRYRSFFDPVVKVFLAFDALCFLISAHE